MLAACSGDADTSIEATTTTGGGPIEWDLQGGLIPRSDLSMSGATVMEADGTRIEQHQDQRIVVTPR